LLSYILLFCPKFRQVCHLGSRFGSDFEAAHLQFQACHKNRKRLHAVKRDAENSC
jgi:hypothetical protein